MMRVLLAGLLFGATALAAAPREVTLYFTANLGGRFPLDNNLDDNHLLRIGSYLRAARVKNPASYHIDLGNAFYPGRLSRYSFGSLTADYLQTLRVDAGLVAAGDLNIGAESLDYIRRARGIRLISANIFRDQNPFFEEFALVDKGGVKTAVIGLTSTRSLLDYAETQMLDLRFEAGEAPLQRALEKARREKPDLTVAVTGLSLEEGVRVLGQNPGIDLLVCGGDSESKVGSEGVRMVELGDGRKIIAMPPGTSLMQVRLAKTAGGWNITQREVIDAFAATTASDVPPSFIRRLVRWQKAYATAEDADVAQAGFAPFKLNADFAAASLRYAFSCDVAYLEAGDIDTENFDLIRKPSDVRYAVQNDYHVFAFRMRGAALKLFYLTHPGLVFSGIDAVGITGYAIRDHVEYRVCTTQRGLIPESKKPENQWLGISDSISLALENKELNPAAAADSRFRFLALINLSNVYETGSVRNASGIETPPGQPADSYFKWGLENDVNFIFYNRRHTISLNPYIFYVRQMDQIIRNLLRGDLTYSYNTEWFVKPYQKNRIDTVVVPIPGTGLRPTFLRETVGAEFQWKFFTGRLGGGLEKEILDPVNNPNWGLEATIAALWEFYPGIRYKLAFDSFSSLSYQNFWRHRVEIGNSVIFTLADPLTFSLGHRWYYFYLGSVTDYYNASVFMASLDLRTAWKYP